VISVRRAHAVRVVQNSATARRQRLTVAYRDAAVEVGCPCGAEARVAADDVDTLMREVKSFIGAHALCEAFGTTTLHLA
jgi:xanthine/CO dehydrogenase XdhC/CoxF family maturation factor